MLTKTFYKLTGLPEASKSLETAGFFLPVALLKLFLLSSAPK